LPLRAHEDPASLPVTFLVWQPPPDLFSRSVRSVGGWLSVQPDVFHAPIVDDAVDHHRPIFHLWLPAIGEAVVKYDRPRPVLRQLAFDLPYQLLALSFIGFH